MTVETSTLRAVRGPIRETANAVSGAIVDGLLTQDDGPTEYEDTPGGGATFCVWLPAA